MLTEVQAKMWRIDLFEKQLSETQKECIDDKSDIRCSFCVKNNSVAEVVDHHQNWLCTAVSPQSRQKYLVLIFETSTGITYNGRDVSCPIMVHTRLRGAVIVSRTNYKILLKNYSRAFLLKVTVKI